MDSQLEKWIERGAKVFPWSMTIGKDGEMKTPLTEHSHLDASNDPAQIDEWFASWPGCNWGAVLPESIFAIDIDVKHGKDGIAAWKKLVDGKGNGKTLIEKTVSGGYHIYFQADGIVKRDVTERKLGDGIDILGVGGWVAIPPSKGYSTQLDAPIAQAPDWLFDKINAPVKKTLIKKGSPTARPDIKPEIAKITLEKLDPERADNYEYWVKVGMALHPMGEVGFELWEDWSKQSSKFRPGVCREKWETFDDDRADGVNFGTLVAWAKEDAVDTAPVDQPRVVIHELDEAFTPRPEIPPVIEGLFSQGTVSVFAGEGGSFKTYLLLCSAMSVASGQPFLNRFTKEMPVLYVDEEMGNAAFTNRVEQVARGLGVEISPNIKWVSMAGFNLLNPNDTAILRQVIRLNGSKYVIIDGLSDVMPGGDENSAGDMTQLFLNLRHIAAEFDVAFAVIHHLNKSGGYRGSSDIKNKPDNLWVIVNSNQNITIRPEKVRDGEPVTIYSKMNITKDPNGKIVSVTAEGTDREETEYELSPAQKELYAEFVKFEKLTVNSANELLPHRTRPAIAHTVNDLKSLGLIETVPGTKSGVAAVYVLTKNELDD